MNIESAISGIGKKFKIQLLGILLAGTTLILMLPAHVSAEEPMERITVVGKRPFTMDIDTFIHSLMQDAYSRRDFHAPALSPTYQEGPDSGCEVGNPVIVSSGAKVERVTDFMGVGNFPVFLTRTYNSRQTVAGAFGKGWSSFFGQRLVIGQNLAGDPWPHYVEDDSGKRAYFPMGNTVPGEPPERYFTTESGGTILETDSHFQTWYLIKEDGTVLVFNANGELMEIRESYFGRKLRMTYQGSNIVAITDGAGRKLRFTWQNDRIVTVEDDAGNQYQYTYLANQMLSHVTYPNGDVHRYHYESHQPHYLTGVSYNGIRYSWFTYNAAGQVVNSRHADDIDKNTFVYSATQTKVTNSLGHETTYQYSNASKSRLTSVQAEGTPYCASGVAYMQYNSDGDPIVMTDMAGAVTHQTFQSRLLRSKKEAVGTVNERTTHYTWDSLNKRLLSITRSDGKSTVIQYNQSGDVSRFEQKNGNESRVWQYNYTYSSNRVPATLIVTQPNGDQEEFIFDVKGQITQRIVDGLVTSYSHYDALGNVGRITYPDGTQMRYQYDSRSRVIVEEARATTGQARI